MSEKVDIKDLNTIKTIAQVLIVIVAFILFLVFADGIIDFNKISRPSSNDKKDFYTFLISMFILSGGFVFLQKSKK